MQPFGPTTFRADVPATKLARRHAERLREAVVASESEAESVHVRGLTNSGRARSLEKAAQWMNAARASTFVFQIA